MGDGISMPSPIAFISDIHANLPALKAVLADIAEQGVSEIICLGDVVGYGGQPAQCVELLRQHGIVTLKGNHDAAVAHGIEAGGRMKLMWDWTEQQLNFEQRSWLAELPMTLERQDFQAVHSMLPLPEEWGYVLTASHANLHFAYQTAPLCFIGHSHRPALWVAGEDAAHDITSPVSLDSRIRQLCNVGSVGQPRDGDCRACYVIYEASQQTVTWRRVSYDISATQKAIEDAGLPLPFAERLSKGM